MKKTGKLKKCMHGLVYWFSCENWKWGFSHLNRSVRALRYKRAYTCDCTDADIRPSQAMFSSVNHCSSLSSFHLLTPLYILEDPDPLNNFLEKASQEESSDQACSFFCSSAINTGAPVKKIFWDLNEMCF